MEQRKKDHISMAEGAQMAAALADPRFDYEPMLGSLQQATSPPFSFLGKTLRFPAWVSSMTGGTEKARTINHNLARACNEFGLGMGLGSCRILLQGKQHFGDFNVRDIMGDELPLFANIGIVQLEELMAAHSLDLLENLVSSLRADGIIIHVNPIQEWLQPDGDRLHHPPLETLQAFLENNRYKVIVKEVGQGMGPESLRQLLKLPLDAIELAAFGGTNFARIELARRLPEERPVFAPLAHIGHSIGDMMRIINHSIDNELNIQCKSLIISGGIQHYLDGFYWISQSRLPAVYGQASAFLQHATGEYIELQRYVASQVEGWQFAQAFLRIRKEA